VYVATERIVIPVTVFLTVFTEAEVENQTNICFATAFYRLVYKSEEAVFTEQATFMDFSVEQKVIPLCTFCPFKLKPY
jgi:hypothetical protein